MAGLRLTDLLDDWIARGEEWGEPILWVAEALADERVDGLLSVAAHPGYAATNLQKVGPQMRGRRVAMQVMEAGNRVLAQSAAAGAQPLLWAATAPSVRGGELYGPRGVYRGGPVRARGAARAYDRAATGALWKASEAATGVHYGLSI